jgi:tRNA nucleotidyltransferase (CCA-adding enzyme)
LPEVSLGASLEEDLRRRDFTANAIAVALNDGRTTTCPERRTTWPPACCACCTPRRSPTIRPGLLRGARYAARLGFAYDEDTAALARAAIDGGALETVTPSRLGAEHRLALGEPQPAATLALPSELLGTHPDRELVSAAVALRPPDALAGHVALAATGPSRARLEALGLPRREVEAILGPVAQAAVAAARGDEAARRWLEVDRHPDPRHPGDDLVAAGLSGPAVGRGLAAARAAMLDGTAPDRESQLAVALAA